MNRSAKRVQKLLALSVRPWSWRALRRGVAASVEHERVLHSLQGEGIGHVIDGGANVGQFSLMARHCLPEATVWAFEPLGSAAATFQRIHGADAMVRLYPYALGEVPAQLTLKVARAADSSSLLRPTSLQEHYFPGTGTAAIETVEVVRLDAMQEAAHLTWPVLLKLDVQGYELAALKGSEGLLSKVRFVYLELSLQSFYEAQPLAAEVIAWLADRGYRVRDIGDLARGADGTVLQFDALFERAGFAEAPGDP